MKFSLSAVILVIGLAASVGYFIVHHSRAAGADVNGDGGVNISDLSILAAHFGLSGQSFSTGDLNGDGSINISDLSVLAAAWGTASSSCSPAVSPTELLTNPGFESSFTSVAPSWNNQVFGNTTGTFSKDTLTPHSGTSDQKIVVTPAPDSSSAVFFLQNFTFASGTTYQGTVWLKSPDGATVDVMFRRNGPYYEPGAIQRITLTPTWTQYTIKGGWDADVPGFFGISFASAGTVQLDEASLRALSGETDCVATQQAIPASFFGMHINKWGNYPTWPTQINFKTLRLWDTGTRWMDLEATKGTWDWRRFDFYVNTAQANGNDPIIYTMGIPPAWATADGSTTAAPVDINDWRNYVQTVATRYKGKIHYWELWNETDQGVFYTGSVDQMYQLTVAANQILKTVDPTNVVLSPNITTYGLGWLDRFLTLGGGQYVDIISWHRYSSYQPELDLPLVDGLKSVMNQHGISKPIWNTEGATAGTPPSSDQALGAIARSYILEWSWGITNFNWYGWDVSVGNPLSQADYTTPTAAGVAYKQTVLWLSSSKLLTKHRDASGTWSVAIQEASGKNAYIVWNDTQTTTFPIPSGWLAQTQRDLTGSSSSIAGASSVPIGPSPILVEP